jgi:hypothetical protein
MGPIEKELVMTTLRRSPTSLMVALSLVGLFVFAPACTNQRVVQVGSHKVTIARHGVQKKIQFNANASEPTFEYKGASNAGIRLEVMITGDKIRVNDRDYGKLRSGDSVLIGDSGVAVNDLSYADSEKYLRANGSTAEWTAQN